MLDPNDLKQYIKHLVVPAIPGRGARQLHVINDNGWRIIDRVGDMNYWYLMHDGTWQYEGGDTWPTLDEAIAAYNEALEKELGKVFVK